MPFSTDEIKHLSILIITYNRKDDLKVCLDSVEEQSYPSYETIVVDNNSTDGTATMIREKYEWVNYLQLEENIGIAARNRGVEQAEGDIILTLDDDSELPTENVLKRVREIFQRDEDLGAAGFRIIDGEGKEEDWFNWPKVGNPRTGYKSPTFLTCGAAFRPEVFERTEGFWEPYFVYVEERDFATRIIASDAEIRYFPNISVIHHRSNVNREEGKFLYYVTRNTIWYIWRNFGFFTALKKTLTHLFRMASTVFQKGEGYGIYLMALGNAIGGFRKVLRTRDPVDKQYLDWIDGRFHQEEDKQKKEKTGDERTE